MTILFRDLLIFTTTGLKIPKKYHIVFQECYEKLSQNEIQSSTSLKKMQVFNKQFVVLHFHTTYSWNIEWQKCAGTSGLWVLNKIIQKKSMKKIVGAIWHSNPAHFHPWAEWAVLFSRQILNDSKDFFILIFWFSFIFSNIKPLLQLNMSAVGSMFQICTKTNEPRNACYFPKRF